MKNIFLLIAGFCANITIAQVNLYTSTTVDWDTVKIPNTAVEPRFLNEDAVILYEKQSIAIEHANVYLTKLYRIKFNTAEGIKQYSSFFVPASNDAFSDYYYVGLDKQNTINRPAYNDYEVSLCAARKMQSTKVYSEEDVKSTQVNERWYNDYVYLPTVGFTIAKNNSFLWEPNKGQSKPASFKFSLSNAEVGSTYDVYYKVRVPLITFLKNASSRILFNSAIPKQIFDLRLSYESDALYVNFINNNIAVLPDTIEEKDKFLTTTLVYKTYNLIGYGRETNMRVSELPNVYFYINSRDYLKPSVNGKVMIAPYDWSQVLYKTTYKISNNSSMMQGKTTLTFDYIRPYNKHYTAPYDEIFVPKKSLEHYITFTDKHNAAVTKLYNKTMEGIDPATDLSCSQRIQKFHTNIVENMEFYTGKERYEKDETLFSVGELALEKNKIFENGRYKLYADFLYRTESNFYRTRMVDKRYETLNQATYFPPNATVDFFSIINNKTFETIFPKASRFGYYVDEYPFYFESTNAVTTPYRIVDTAGLMPPSFTKTHNSGFSSNIRVHTYTVTVDLATNTCSFNGNISLSGQFSTLTRSAYSHNAVSDSSVNRNYYKKLTDQKNIQNIKTKVVSTETKFPFKCKIDQSFNFNELCLRADKEYTIDLSKLTCHVIENLENRERNMTYYSDFLMHDIFRYTIVFSKPVTISNEVDLKKEPVINSFGAYFNKVTVASPTQLNFESNFKILAEKTPASTYKEVLDFYQNTAHNKNLVLIFSVN